MSDTAQHRTDKPSTDEHSADGLSTGGYSPERGAEAEKAAGPSQLDRILGCLLGGAIGDALGAPLEFLSLAQIREQYGADGLTRFTPAYGRIGAITDDTQMTLFTAEGLIRGLNRSRDRGLCNPVMVLGNAYSRWLNTQGYDWQDIPCGEFSSSEPSGWLIRNQVLRHRRAPGNTCLSALHRPGFGSIPAPNNSKGCGGVMRMAPVGLVARDPFKLGSNAASLTHGHPTGYLAAGAFAHIVAALYSGSDLSAAIETARTRLQSEPKCEETLAAMDAATALAREGAPSAEQVETLGGGWIAEEALAISLYCALVAEDFRRGVLLAANHSGDCDSTGAITGNLLGTLFGVKAIPVEWVEEVEGRDLIRTLATDLAANVGATDPALSGTEVPDYDRYPPW